MSDTLAAAYAQEWHDRQVSANPEHEQFSACWCCCTSCDPDWVEGEGNPHFAQAQTEMRGGA